MTLVDTTNTFACIQCDTIHVNSYIFHFWISYVNFSYYYFLLYIEKTQKVYAFGLRK